MNLNEVAWRPPKIETDRLVLRGYELDDAAAIYAYASDAEVTPYMSFDTSRSVDEVLAFLNGVVAVLYERQELSYVITRREEPERVIGALGVVWRPLEHQVLELGYILAKEHWGQGYVPEAGRALMRFAFETTNAARIFAPIFAPNAKSRRAAEKMGLAFEGIQRSALAHRGQRWDEAFYAVLRGELM
jgi:RimJ/RimL family protein N-acetyltransferase